MAEEKRFDTIVGKIRLRARLREFIGKHISNRKQAMVMCFPGEHGREIDQIYRKLGIPDKNIIGIERNKETARKIHPRYPDIYLAIGDMVQLCKGYTGPPISVLSLDYCGNFSEDKFRPIYWLGVRRKLAENCVIFVNLFGGREQEDQKSQLRGIHLSHLMSKNLSGFIANNEDHRELLKATFEEANKATISEAREFACAEAITRVLRKVVPSVIAEKELKYRLRKDFLAKSIDWRGSDPTLLIAQGGTDILADIRQYMDSKSAVTAALHLSLAFFDRQGGYLPMACERYRYINNGGNPMLSDMIYLKSASLVLEGIAPMVGIDGDKLVLMPSPAKCKTLEDWATVLTGSMNKMLHATRNEIDATEDISRQDLGGGCLELTENMKKGIIMRIRHGWSNEKIMSRYPVTPGTLAAWRAHISMGTYAAGQ